jgi:hypothetical protein
MIFPESSRWPMEDVVFVYGWGVKRKKEEGKEYGRRKKVEKKMGWRKQKTKIRVRKKN